MLWWWWRWQVREVADVFSRRMTMLRFQSEALLALQESAEAYLVRLFEDAYVAQPSAVELSCFASYTQIPLYTY